MPCLDGQTGFLIKQGHDNAAAERILLLARDPQLRATLGQRGQTFVRANFSVEQMVNTIHQRYKTLITHKANRPHLK